PFIKKIQGRFDEQDIRQTLQFVYENLPLFLDGEDYRTIRNRLSSDSIPALVEANFKSLISPSGIVSREFILRDPAGISFLGLEKLQQLKVGDDFTLRNGYVLTRDEKNLLLFITPNLP